MRLAFCFEKWGVIRCFRANTRVNGFNVKQKDEAIRWCCKIFNGLY